MWAITGIETLKCSVSQTIQMYSNTWPDKVTRFIVSNSSGYFHISSVYNLLIFYLKFLLGQLLHIVQPDNTVS